MDVLITIFSSKLNDNKITDDMLIDSISNSIPDLSDESMENLSLFIGYVYWRFTVCGKLINVNEDFIANNLNKIFGSRKHILNNAYENFDIHLTKMIDTETFKYLEYLDTTMIFDKDNIPQFKNFFHENLVLKYGDVSEIDNTNDDVTIFI